MSFILAHIRPDQQENRWYVMHSGWAGGVERNLSMEAAETAVQNRASRSSDLTLVVIFNHADLPARVFTVKGGEPWRELGPIENHAPFRRS